MGLSGRIALFGGTFDPPHRAHVQLAHAARKACAADHVVWIPTGQPWQKMGAVAGAAPRRVSPALDRAAMTAMTVADVSVFSFDPLEVRREGPTYTIDTVDALQQRWPDAQLILVMGQDQYERFTTWHRWEELLARVELAVAGRPARSGSAGVGAAHVPGSAPIDAKLRGARPVIPIAMPPSELSSTDIRRRAAARLAIAPDVAPAVARYIEEQGLYRDAPPPPTEESRPT